MIKATVTGSVWATRRLDEIPRGAFLEVQSDDGARLVAFDVLGSGLGERVLVATGSVASGWFAPEHPPLDALIIGSLDAASGSAAGDVSQPPRQQGDRT
jgi:ethanolamine utilization protein EutN